MSASQLEIKQSVENSVTGCTFNWDTCPPELSQAFKKALGTEGGILKLGCYGVTVDDALTHIALFLNTYPRITTLDISDNNIGDAGAEALAGNTTLRTLNISKNDIGDAGARALAGNTTLTTLDISKNDIDARGARFLANNATLTTLNMSWNIIGDAGARALADNTTLTTLDISYNRIGPKGAKSLANNATLTTLNMSWNIIGASGARALAGNTTLTNLCIIANILGDAGARALAGNTTLKTLDISNNQISDAGATALASNTTLTTLNISANRIRDAGAAVLASNTTLTTLNISWNYFEDAGAIALANNATLTALDVCYIDNIGLPGTQALIQCQQNRIETCKKQKLAFLMGTRKDSFMQILGMFDENLLGGILSFIEAKPLNLDFHPKIMSSFSSCENNIFDESLSLSAVFNGTAYNETKEIKSEHERMVEAVTFTFGNDLSLLVPDFDDLADDNEVKVSSETQEVETKTQQEYNEMNAYVLDPTDSDSDANDTFEIQQAIEKSIRNTNGSGFPLHPDYRTAVNIGLLGMKRRLFLAQKPNLTHNFSPEIMSAFSSCENNTPSASLSASAVCNGAAHNEIKETKEEHERTVQAQILREANALHCSTPQTLDHDVKAVTFVFRNTLTTDRETSVILSSESAVTFAPFPSTGLLAFFRKCCRKR